MFVYYSHHNTNPPKPLRTHMNGAQYSGDREATRNDCQVLCNILYISYIVQWLRFQCDKSWLILQVLCNILYISYPVRWSRFQCDKSWLIVTTLWLYSCQVLCNILNVSYIVRWLRFQCDNLFHHILSFLFLYKAIMPSQACKNDNLFHYMSSFLCLYKAIMPSKKLQACKNDNLLHYLMK